MVLQLSGPRSKSARLIFIERTKNHFERGGGARFLFTAEQGITAGGHGGTPLQVSFEVRCESASGFRSIAIQEER